MSVATCPDREAGEGRDREVEQADQLSWNRHVRNLTQTAAALSGVDDSDCQEAMTWEWGQSVHRSSSLVGPGGP